MRKYLLKTVFSLLIVHSVYSQQDQLISGGETVASMVGADKKAYVWGNNLGGMLGTGSTSSYVPVPTMVQLPGGVDVQQISSGSGNHFLALDCIGGVYGWGQNYKGQVGNGSFGDIIRTPTRVKAGVLAGDFKYDDGSGFLVRGVKTVYAASENSFAILEDGRLISWGANSQSSDQHYFDKMGQLGDGTTIDKLTPVFVVSGPGLPPLRDVVSVSAGDGAAYALSEDGIVYSWGNGLNGTLGRDAAGTRNPSSPETVQDSYARPVYLSSFRKLENIVSISAGDVFGMALGADGYVWTWGNGAWNNATGNTRYNYSGSDPRRVLKGNTTGSGSNDGLYLLAKSIGGGQGYGMAVTLDGKPVAWGGQGLVAPGGSFGVCSQGGLTGTGSTETAVPVSYIRRESGFIDDDVIAIFRGDTWGYYQTSEGRIYTWGCNLFGQLGNITTTDQPTAIQMSPPLGTFFPDPRPTITVTPFDTTLCESELKANGVTLNAGFVISPQLSSLYRITWKRLPNEIVKEGVATEANLSYHTTTPGVYQVSIKYTGTKGNCVGYPDAVSYANVDVYLPPFFAYASTANPRRQVYCGDSAYVGVYSNEGSIVNYYSYNDPFLSLGSSVGTGITKLILPDHIPNKGVGTITLYAEETNYTSGTLFRKSDACNRNWDVYDVLNSGISYQSGFRVYENDITITNVTIRLKSEIVNVGETYSTVINFGVYGSKQDQNSPYMYANQSYSTGSFSYNFTRTRTIDEPAILEQDIIVPVNVKLPVGVWFLSLKEKALTTTSGSSLLSIGRGSCTQYPLSGNPNLIDYSYNSTNFNSSTSLTQGYFFNISFKAGQHFCDRIPIDVKLDCIVTGNEEMSHISLSSKISPNPFKDQLVLETNGPGKVVVYNSSGLEIEQKIFSEASKTYLGQGWPKGFYLIHLTENGVSKMIKVIKQD